MRALRLLKHVIMLVGLGLLFSGIYWDGPAFAIAIGGFISLIFAVLYAFNAYNAAMRVYLRYFGERVRTTYVEARPNPLTYVNDVHPYNVMSLWQHPRTGTIHEFKSENLWFDLSQYNHDGEITVYIKPDDPGTYYMDMSFLSTRTTPALKDPFADTDADEEMPLGPSVRANWVYLVGPLLFGPYIFILEPMYRLPTALSAIVFFTTLGLAMVPVFMRKAPFMFWVLAIGLWMLGCTVAALSR